MHSKATDLTADQVRARLQELVNSTSQNKAAAALGVSRCYLNNVLHGREWPGPAICGPLQLLRVFRYVSATPEPSQPPPNLVLPRHPFAHETGWTPLEAAAILAWGQTLLANAAAGGEPEVRT